MTTAKRRFDGEQANRLLAFCDAARHFPGVRAVEQDLSDGVATVYFDGHKACLPAPLRDVATALDIPLPATNTPNSVAQGHNSDDFQHGYRGPGYKTDHPQTVVTFRLEVDR